jgi:hypothetical protein
VKISIENPDPEIPQEFQLKFRSSGIQQKSQLKFRHPGTTQKTKRKSRHTKISIENYRPRIQRRKK